MFAIVCVDLCFCKFFPDLCEFGFLRVGEYRGGLATTLLRHVHTEVAVQKGGDWGGLPPKPCLTGLRVF